MTEERSLPSAVALEAVLRRGREQFDAGQVEGALRTFDDALRSKPTYAPAWRAKGRALRAAGDPRAALDCYAEALRCDPEDEASWFGLALSLHALGRRKDEALAYDELLRRNPRSVAAWMNRGVAHHEARRYEEALACYDRILSLRPEVAAAWSNRGAALLRLGHHEEALASFDDALALDPTFGDAAANRQAVLAQLGREEPLPAAIVLPPPAVLLPVAQARVLANLGLPALEAFRDAPPARAEDYLALGTALLDDGNPQGAAAAFAKAEGFGGGAVAALGRVLALEVQGDAHLAEEASRILAVHPSVPRIAFAVARIRETLGDLPGALAAIEPLVADRPDLAWAGNWKGLLELALGRVGDARLSFEGATAADPDDADAWANLAAALSREGDPDGALAACDRALAIDPAHPAAWNNRGVVLASLGNARDAEASLRNAAKESEDVAILMNRARFVEARGRHRLAARFYGAALSRAPGRRDALAGRQRSLGRLGAEARARRRTPRRAQKRKGRKPRAPARGR